MLCAVITGPTYAKALEQIDRSSQLVDLLEFRLDLFSVFTLDHIKALLQHAPIPVIFTLRSASQGGCFVGTETERLVLLKQLISLCPHYLDLEYTLEPQFFASMREKSPHTKLICSYHNFIETPLDLMQLYHSLKKMPADIIKIATMANSSLDGLRMLKLTRQLTQAGETIIGHCMGKLGQFTRIAGTVFGNHITYASLEENLQNAPGQLSIKTLLHTYHYRQLNAETVMLGLIGGNVDYSLSHQTHNALIRKLEAGINALYVKIQIQTEELADFFTFAQELNFHGLSVTMPLKESAIPWTAHCDPSVDEIKALNTLVLIDTGFEGSNTDRTGAMLALSLATNISQLKGKKVLILGAGGVAKAIAFELVRRGADLLILNRTPERAAELAARLGCRSGSLTDTQLIASENYEILINCTSVGRGANEIELPIEPQWIIPGTIAMDVIASPKETSFLKEAKKRNCTLIYGEEMFKFQAIQQFLLWFDLPYTAQEMKELWTTPLQNHL